MFRRHNPPYIFWAAIVLIGCSGVAGAQQTGRIEGRISGSDGTSLSGVSVAVTGVPLSALSDDEGRFVVDRVPVGTVTVTFSSGSNVDVIADVVVPAGVLRLDRTIDWKVGYAETLRVFAASRRSERLFHAPASVAIVTDAPIAREAAHGQLPKVLEATPGVELAQSGVFDFNVNIRGLNSALTRRVLTLVDGRDAASVLIGAQEWAAFALPVDEVSRIEIARGPGAALYGPNAFNGVIDITSKEPRASPGGTLDFTAGEAGSARVSARQAGALTAQSFYRVHAVYGRTADFYQSRVAGTEYPGLPREVAPLARDSTTFLSAGARLDHYFGAERILTSEGGLAHTDGSVFLTAAGRLQNTGALRPWLRAAFQTPAWRMTGYYDGRNGDMRSLATGSTIVDRSLKASAEATRRFELRRGGIALGGAYRFLRADTNDDSGQPTILRGVQRAHERSLHGQVDQTIGQAVRVMVALRADDSTLHDLEWSPRVAVVFAPAATHSVRVSYGHAFQTGSFVHYFTRTAVAPAVSLSAVEAALQPALGGVPLQLQSVPVLALGNEQLEVERVDTMEIGYSGVVRGRVLVTANYYYNRIHDLITPLLPQVGTGLGRINPDFPAYAPPPQLSAGQQALVRGALASALPPSLFATMSNDLDGRPIFAAASYANFARADLQGAEVSAQLFASNRFSADLGYSALRFTPRVDVGDDLVSANAPPQKVTTGLTYDDGVWTGALRYRWADAFFWNGGVFRGRVPAASLVDATARYRIRQRTSVQVNVANLLDHEHYQVFGGDVLQRRALVSIVQRW